MKIDIPLFTRQLSELLKSPADHLEAVCDLLRVHTSAAVSIKNRDGTNIIEILGEENSAENNLSLDIGLGARLILHASEFSENDKLAATIAGCLCTVLLKHREEIFSAEKKRRVKAVRTIINSLSFSELEASKKILEIICENNKTEGLLIAGHIADKLGFTRSVITGALRKLEGANLIETRSLGMKGTYIRIKDALLYEELAKI